MPRRKPVILSMFKPPEAAPKPGAVHTDAMPPGFRYLPDAVPLDLAATLMPQIRELPWEQKTVNTPGGPKPVPRLVCMFGPVPYSYAGVKHDAAPIPDFLLGLKSLAEKLSGQPFNAVLLNQYRTNSDSVGWHSDDDYNHAGRPVIASVSLGGPRRFQIRPAQVGLINGKPARRGRPFTVELGHTSVVIMGPDAQRQYQHRIPKESGPMLLRYNLTFRWMA